jgi:hypothetical protein
MKEEACKQAIQEAQQRVANLKEKLQHQEELKQAKTLAILKKKTELAVLRESQRLLQSSAEQIQLRLQYLRKQVEQHQSEGLLIQQELARVCQASQRTCQTLNLQASVTRE